MGTGQHLDNPSIVPGPGYFVRWTSGCLNAIGAGLEGLGLDEEGVRLCRRALERDGILVVVQPAARPGRRHDR